MTDDTPVQGLGQEVTIDLSARQAATLAALLRAREQADHELQVYTAAIIAGSDCEGGEFISLRAAENGHSAALVLRVT
jgi:hypothetical protein